MLPEPLRIELTLKFRPGTRLACPFRNEMKDRKGCRAGLGKVVESLSVNREVYDP